MKTKKTKKYRNLRDSSSCASSVCLAPVPSSKSVFQARGNCFSVNGKQKIDLFAIVNALLKRHESEFHTQTNKLELKSCV